MEQHDMEHFIISRESTLPAAMQKIDDNSNGLLFVVNGQQELCGVVSDGDIRRWILKGGHIDTEIFPLMNSGPRFLYEFEREKASEIMRLHDIRALPIINEDRQIVDIILEKEKTYRKCPDRSALKDLSVVIMAGGQGTRLYPYTKILPKPLIPIGEIPIVERVIDSFYEYGIERFFMTVNYKKNMIQSYFSDISANYSIKYIEEDKPLGTGGSIKLIGEKFARPLFVANCDSLIRTDYSLLYKHHIETGNAITIVTSLKNDTIPYGVVYPKGDGEIDRLVEKPTRSYFINTGMYIINPEMIDLIPGDTVYHMTYLVGEAMAQGYKVGMYPVSEDSFLDMGEFAEMKRMEEKLNIQ